MRKTFKYRIYLTKSQELKFNSQLEICRKLYNHFLSERKTSFEETGKGVAYYAQKKTIPLLKVNWPELKDVYSQVLQNVAERVDLAYQAFFRRVKEGTEKPGFPRFKGVGRYDSLTYTQYGSGIKIKDNRLVLSGIGHVKIVLHRPLEGTPKTATIKRSSTGKWYVSFSCEIEAKEPLPKSDLNVGIDVGLETFAYMSDNTKIENPRFFRQEEKNLAKAQRKLDSVTKKDKKGKVLNAKEPVRLKAKKVLSRVHERIGFKRKDFAHQESRKLVDKYQIIAVEDLEVNRMVHNHCLAKSVSDASWSMFASILSYKAEEAGRTVVFVNPAYTSQDCSGCGHREKKTLAQRTHHCKCCGLKLHRDLNSSINIERLGLQSLGENP